MAAGGWKIFTAGDVLTADDTMDYLQQGVLVFDSSGARGSAIASPGEGQFSYLKDTDATEYYDGASWTPVAQGGLVHIVTESFSAVSSVSIDNCFSGDYDNYRVLVNVNSTTSSADVIWRLRASGTDNATSNSSWTRIYSGHTSYSPASGGDNSGVSYWQIGTLNGSTVTTAMDIFNPNAAAPTRSVITSITDRFAATGYTYIQYGGGHDSGSTSWDGFTANFAASSTGTVSVYGYKS